MSVIEKPQSPLSAWLRIIYSSPWLAVLPALLLLAAVLGWPLLTLLIRSFAEPHWGLQNYQWFFNAKVNLAVLSRTFSISAWVALICVLAAYPYAWMMTAVSSRMRLVLILCVLIPFWVSGVVRTLTRYYAPAGLLQ